jgi:hypothetical protein
MKRAITLLLILCGYACYGQSTTYSNNLGTNYINGRTGTFNKSSFTWTISQNGTQYNIKTNATSTSFNVIYSHFDSSNKLYMYKSIGNADFDGSRVISVMSNMKLSDLAKGTTGQLNLLAIVFEDNSGYIYKLNK